MKKLAKRLAEKSGATLVVVITIFAVVVIAGSLLITIGSASYKNSISFHNQKQAYYTARSVMDTVIKGLSDTTTWAGSGGSGGIKDALSSATPNADGHRVITASGSSLEGMGDYDVEIKQVSASGSRVELKVTVKSSFKGKGYVLKATLKEQSSDFEPIRFAFFARQGSVTIAPPTGGSAIVDGDVFGRGALNIRDTLLNAGDVSRSTAVITNGAFGAVDSQINGNLIVDTSHGTIDIYSPSTMLGKLYTDDASRYTPGAIPPSSFDLEVVAREDIGMNDAIETNIREIDKSFVKSTHAGVFHFANGLMANPALGMVKLSNGAVLADEGSGLVAWENYTEYSTNYSGSQAFTSIEDMETTYGIKLPLKSVDTATSTIELLDGDSYSISNKTYTFMSDDPTPSAVGTIDLGTEYYGAFPLDDIILDDDGSFQLKAAIPLKGGLPSTPGGSITITDKLCRINASDFTGTYNFNTGVLQEGVDGDIRVFLETSSTAVDFDNVNIKVTGDNNVYFYFPDNVVWINIDDSNIGESAVDEAQLYFISSAMGLSCKMNADSRFKGIMYYSGLGSDFSLNGSASSGDEVIVGSISANSIAINSSGMYRFSDLHKEPYFKTTLDTSEYFIYSRKHNAGWKVSYGD